MKDYTSDKPVKKAFAKAKEKKHDQSIFSSDREREALSRSGKNQQKISNDFKTLRRGK